MLILAVRVAKENGTAVIIISHRPAVLEAVDKVLMLKNGRVDSFVAIPANQSIDMAELNAPRRGAAIKLAPA
jgi:ABC-type protease/lipase transport system fused ATPase/permease subunit